MYQILFELFYISVYLKTMMMKLYYNLNLEGMKLFAMIGLFFLCACNSEKGSNHQQNNMEEAPAAAQQKPADNEGQYIIVKVSDRNPERIEETEDFWPVELRTARLKDDKVVTTFKASLGTFDDDHFYGLELLFVRAREKSALAIGSYKIVAFGDGVNLQPTTDNYFEAINTINLETFNNIVALGAKDDHPDDFYAPLNDENVLVISSIGDLVETENSNEYISEHFQRVKGYLSFNIIKVQTDEQYNVRVDFDLINEIRIPKGN